MFIWLAEVIKVLQLHSRIATSPTSPMTYNRWLGKVECRVEYQGVPHRISDVIRRALVLGGQEKIELAIDISLIVI